ncbi:hypothetical protein MLD38_021469 [Melastoma candidum]|uniref:Uncharacterized protein n=1 Tax=Melastoma candidum TaxID=119954 RepID=A0ACB9QFK7_9MYRT|nr:hypothetical protein MLD38_021469 [Melastoma candidum]
MALAAGTTSPSVACRIAAAGFVGGRSWWLIPLTFAKLPLLPGNQCPPVGFNFRSCYGRPAALAYGREAGDGFPMVRDLGGVEQSSIYILPGKTICLADFKEQWNMNADTDEMFDELFNKYGKVVFSRKDKRPPTTEIDDDSESLLFTVEMARVASEVKAADIKVLFVKPLVYWTRFFIIATAFSRPQIDTIGSKMRDLVEKKYGKVPSGDAKPNSWTLLDYVMLLSTYFFLNRGRSITWKNSMETLL